MKMDFISRRCPICGENGPKDLYDNITYVREFKNFGPEVKKCNICGMIYLDPIMSDDSYENFYNKDEQRKFVAKYIKDYDNKINQQTYRRLRIINKLLPTLFCRNISLLKLLDVGSGCSNFPKLAKEYLNLNSVFGLEPSKSRIEEAKNKFDQEDILIQGDLFCNEIEDYNPDIITAFQVLEHVSNINEFLNQVRNILSLSGILILEVPNHDDILVSLPKYRKFYYQNAHCNYFNPNTLKIALEQNGFRVLHMLKIQRYSFDNHLHWLTKGKPGKFNFKFFNWPYSCIIKLFNRHDTILSIAERV